MPLCSECRSEAEVTVVGPPDPAWAQWLSAMVERLSADDPDTEPDRCSRCDNCGGEACR